MPDIQFPGGRLRFNDDALDTLAVGPSGDVARYVQGACERIVQEAKRLAPVSPDGSNGRPSGYLRSHIGFELRRQGDTTVGVIHSTATTPDGKPYALFQEVGWTTRAGNRGKHTPYLRPAMERERARGFHP